MLPARVPVAGDWRDLAVADDTEGEFDRAESRCLRRERLHEAVGADLGAQLTPSVRALFSGPCGTGKPLATHLLAGALGKELNEFPSYDSSR